MPSFKVHNESKATAPRVLNIGTAVLQHFMIPCISAQCRPPRKAMADSHVLTRRVVRMFHLKVLFYYFSVSRCSAVLL
jgi:hypothetical protein